jgi:hypothetical protein
MIRDIKIQRLLQKTEPVPSFEYNVLTKNVIKTGNFILQVQFIFKKGRPIMGAKIGTLNSRIILYLYPGLAMDKNNTQFNDKWLILCEGHF